MTIHLRFPRRRAGSRLACLISLLACSTKATDRAPDGKPSLVAAIDSISLDSCATLDRQSHPQARVLAPGETIPAPLPGSWSEVKRLSAGPYSLVVPRTTTVARPDSTVVAIFDFPGCRFFCALNVGLVDDSLDRSLDAYVASQRVADSAADPGAVADIGPPPTPIHLGQQRGLIMDGDCGDCTERDIIVRRGRRVAHIGLSIDDRDGYQPGIMCRMTRVATTFPSGVTPWRKSRCGHLTNAEEDS